MNVKDVRSKKSVSRGITVRLQWKKEKKDSMYQK